MVHISMEKHIFEFETLNLQDQISQRKIEFRDGVESLQDSEAGQMVKTPDWHAGGPGFKSRCRLPPQTISASLEPIHSPNPA